MSKKRRSKRGKKSMKRASSSLARVGKALAGLLAMFTAGVIGGATSRQIATTARELTRPIRHRVARAWRRIGDEANGATGASAR
jgi:hypothetical protein